MILFPDRASPASAFGGAPRSRRQPARFDPDPAHGPHGPSQAARVGRSRGKVEEGEKGYRTRAHNTGGQGTFEHASPRVYLTVAQFNLGTLQPSNPRHEPPPAPRFSKACPSQVLMTGNCIKLVKKRQIMRGAQCPLLRCDGFSIE